MLNSDTLVSIGLPVRNAGNRLTEVVRSVLAQDHERFELVISDNASTDDTEAVCRALAKTDRRISYHRQSMNVGLLNNFQQAINLARGTYFRWIGDDDQLEPNYLSESLRAFAEDPRLILVTSELSYTGPDGQVQTGPGYDGTALGADDPVGRLTEMLRLLNESHLLIDPLYGLVLRAPVAAIERRNMLKEDEVFATKLALAGPWAHVPKILARRNWKHEKIGQLARRLGVPGWQSHFSNTLQCREMLRWLNQIDLSAYQRQQGRVAVLRWYQRRQQRVLGHRSRKLLQMAVGRR